MALIHKGLSDANLPNLTFFKSAKVNIQKRPLFKIERLKISDHRQSRWYEEGP